MKSVRNVKLFSSGILLLVLCAIGVSVYQASKLNTRYSIKEFFPRNHPILENDEINGRTFSLEESSTFFVTLTLRPQFSGNWLEKKRIDALEKIANGLGSVHGVKQVRSIANLEMAIENGSVLEIGPLLKSLPQKKWQSFVKSHALLRPQLVSQDMRSAMIVLEPAINSNEGLNHIREEVLRQASGSEWDVRVGGLPAVQSRLAEKLHSEVGKFLIASLALFCLMFIAFYRNWTPVLFAGFGLIVTNATTLAWISFFGIPFTVLLSTLPIIVSIAFVSLAIHTLHLWSARFNEENPQGVARFGLSMKVLKEIALPNFLGSMTTAIGFITLAVTNIPAIRTYGLVIAASVMWVWVMTQVLLIGFQHLFVPQPRKWNHARAGWMLRVNRYSIPVFATTLALSVVLGSTFGHLNFSGQLFDDLPETESVRQATEFLDQHFGGTVALNVAVIPGKDEAWKDPQELKKLKGALEEIRAIDGVGSALGVSDFFSPKLPKTKGAAAEMYFLFSMAPENPLRHFVSADFREARIAARLSDLPSNQVAYVRQQIRDIIAKTDSHWEIRESGLAVNSHALNQEVAHQLVFGFWHSLLIIGCLLMFVFRSLRWALVACLPNLVPPAVLIGSLALMQTPVKPGIALIFSIALGLAFNNTVYLLSRLKRIQKEKMMKTLPLRRALLEEGNPCFSESFIMFVGFFIFLASDFNMNQTFGAYMVLSIVAGALGDLIFLPAMLKEFSSFLWAKGAQRPERPVLTIAPLQDRGLELEESADEKKSSTIAASWAALALLTGFAMLFAAKPVMAAANQTVKAKPQMVRRSVANAPAAPVQAAPAQAAKPVAATTVSAMPTKGVSADVAEILKKAKTHLASKSDQAKVTMTIIEANGEKKTREMTLQSMQTRRGFKALVRLSAPADIKGTALLAEVEGSAQRQWLYLPSNKQVRRVASSNKSTGVLGSELNPEDLNPTALRGAATRLLKKDDKWAVIEVIPRKGTSEYSRVLTTFSWPEGLPQRTDYYVGNQAQKTVEFTEYTGVGGTVQRAQKIRIRNLARKRGTDLDFSEMKVNSSLSSKDFTPDALKESW